MEGYLRNHPHILGFHLKCLVFYWVQVSVLLTLRLPEELLSPLPPGSDLPGSESHPPPTLLLPHSSLLFLLVLVAPSCPCPAVCPKRSPAPIGRTLPSQRSRDESQSLSSTGAGPGHTKPSPVDQVEAKTGTPPAGSSSPHGGSTVQLSPPPSLPAPALPGLLECYTAFVSPARSDVRRVIS